MRTFELGIGIQDLPLVCPLYQGSIYEEMIYS